MFDWTDPDTGDVYEIMYNVTQTEDEGPEHFMWRLKASGGFQVNDNDLWHKLPPFVSASFMLEMEEELFGGPAIHMREKVGLDSNLKTLRTDDIVYLANTGIKARVAGKPEGKGDMIEVHLIEPYKDNGPIYLIEDMVTKI